LASGGNGGGGVGNRRERRVAALLAVAAAWAVIGSVATVPEGCPAASKRSGPCRNWTTDSCMIGHSVGGGGPYFFFLPAHGSS